MLLAIDLTQIDPMWILGGAISGVVAIGAAVKAFKDIRRSGWEPFRDKWITPRRARRERIDQLFVKFENVESTCSAMGGQLDEVLKEFRPNGGATIKDQLVSIDGKVENIIAQKRHEMETSEWPKFMLDEHGEMTMTNSAFRDLVGAEDEELMHNGYMSRMVDDDRRRFYRNLQDAIELIMPTETIVKFRLHGPHFVTVKIVISPDVRHGGVLKRFFGSAIKLDTTIEQ